LFWPTSYQEYCKQNSSNLGADREYELIVIYPIIENQEICESLQTFIISRKKNRRCDSYRYYYYKHHYCQVFSQFFNTICCIHVENWNYAKNSLYRQIHFSLRRHNFMKIWWLIMITTQGTIVKLCLQNIGHAWKLVFSFNSTGTHLLNWG